MWDRNGARREWSGGAAQKYAVWKKLQAGSAAWLARQEKLRTKANEKRSKAAKKQPRKNGKLAAGASTDSTRTSANPERAAKAHAAGVDQGTVAKVDAVVAANPELLEGGRGAGEARVGVYREQRTRTM